jgi:TM2 domain.
MKKTQIFEAEPGISYVTSSSTKSKKTTLLLCGFLGFLGAHDFYAGKIVKGLFKMATLNFIGLGWLIDTLKILSNTYRDGAKLPINKW